jgi:hypothetical protein
VTLRRSIGKSDNRTGRTVNQPLDFVLQFANGRPIAGSQGGERVGGQVDGGLAKLPGKRWPKETEFRRVLPLPVAELLVPVFDDVDANRRGFPQGL